MVKGRYWITIARSDSKFHRDQRAVTTPTLAEAERQAQVLLRVKRLTAMDGAAWDRWTVMTTGSPHALPKVVAYGDHLDTHYSERDNGWTD
jgi:hypothetical protein